MRIVTNAQLNVCGVKAAVNYKMVDAMNEAVDKYCCNWVLQYAEANDMLAYLIHIIQACKVRKKSYCILKNEKRSSVFISTTFMIYEITDVSLQLNTR